MPTSAHIYEESVCGTSDIVEFDPAFHRNTPNMQGNRERQATVVTEFQMEAKYQQNLNLKKSPSFIITSSAKRISMDIATGTSELGSQHTLSRRDSVGKLPEKNKINTFFMPSVISKRKNPSLFRGNDPNRRAAS